MKNDKIESNMIFKKVTSILKRYGAKYMELTATSRATAKRDLSELVSKNILVLKGKGIGAYYELSK